MISGPSLGLVILFVVIAFVGRKRLGRGDRES